MENDLNSFSENEKRAQIFDNGRLPQFSLKWKTISFLKKWKTTSFFIFFKYKFIQQHIIAEAT